MNPGDVLARFQGLRRSRNGWLASCPGPNHRRGDRNRSLSLALGDDGRVLVNCFACCKTEEIIAAAGLSLRDLFPTDSAPTAARPRPAGTTLDEARRDVLRQGRRQLARIDLESYADADAVRVGRRAVLAARAAATRLGDCDEAWALLAGAAALERDILVVESRLEGVA